eukprot:111316_1
MGSCPSKPSKATLKGSSASKPSKPSKPSKENKSKNQTKINKEWLISGYFNDCKTESNAYLPLEINKTIQIYVGELYRKKSIAFDRKQAGKCLEFITDTRIRKTTDRKCSYSTVLTNQIIDPKISKKWKVRYKVRSEKIVCCIGYSLKKGIRNYDHAIGRGDNGSSNGNGSRSCVARMPKFNDEFELIFNFTNNKIWSALNNENPEEIMNIVPQHKGKQLIPAVSLYDKEDQIEILSFGFK